MYVYNTHSFPSILRSTYLEKLDLLTTTHMCLSTWSIRLTVTGIKVTVFSLSTLQTLVAKQLLEVAAVQILCGLSSEPNYGVRHGESVCSFVALRKVAVIFLEYTGHLDSAVADESI